MFTGIIEETGTVQAIERQGDAIRIRIAAARVLEGTKHGDSIAVNGVCLTVCDFDEDSFTADVMQVTLDYTTLGSIQVGQRVNMERATATGQRLGGHIVQGHVDGTAQLVSRTPSEHWEVFRFTLDDPHLGRYVAKKGSIAINGTSLTVAEITDSVALESAAQWFEVSLIPTTLADTMLGDLSPGDKVNVECDVLAKYLERQRGFGNSGD
ncbi:MULTISPECIES: riboflavin synthase [Corynebacterium]|uniref:riboflavin synthase n=1 Tax=Corynebacterium TaxID=1716 RepID=UPI0008A659B4|nr:MULTISPECIES: riboflavin synthase [Corynebacterium]MCX2162885.1 riboflavin synthase [Corynebacterium auriscanis]OFT87016.1 riboflavin synthase subunit alpha [Corynebacterium sp. HMSC28B08]